MVWTILIGFKSKPLFIFLEKVNLYIGKYTLLLPYSPCSNRREMLRVTMRNQHVWRLGGVFTLNHRESTLALDGTGYLYYQFVPGLRAVWPVWCPANPCHCFNNLWVKVRHKFYLWVSPCYSGLFITSFSFILFPVDCNSVICCYLCSRVTLGSVFSLFTSKQRELCQPGPGCLCRCLLHIRTQNSPWPFPPLSLSLQSPDDGTRLSWDVFYRNNESQQSHSPHSWEMIEIYNLVVEVEPSVIIMTIRRYERPRQWPDSPSSGVWPAPASPPPLQSSPAASLPPPAASTAMHVCLHAPSDSPHPTSPSSCQQNLLLKQFRVYTLLTSFSSLNQNYSNKASS